MLPVPKIAETALQRLTGLEPFPQPPLVRLRYPVVLMHGFGMLASVRRGGHLHDEAMHLRQHGVLAFAPNVVPYNVVPIRAAMWKRRIERVLDETGADRVNLIAKSMGGLDARYLISEMGMHETVASLLTISTPHHGTAIADLVLDQPEMLQAWGAELMNWVGTNTLAEEASDIRRAVVELTPRYVCETFNPSVPDHPSVRYASYAGAAGKGTDHPISPFMRINNLYLYGKEGPNDGMVSVESAKWGEFLGTIPADHSHQVGLQLTLRYVFDSNGFYLGLATRLAEEGC